MCLDSWKHRKQCLSTTWWYNFAGKKRTKKTPKTKNPPPNYPSALIYNYCTTVWMGCGAGPSSSSILLLYFGTQVRFPTRYTIMCQRPWHEIRRREAAHSTTSSYRQCAYSTTMTALPFQSECSNQLLMLQVQHYLCSSSQSKSNIKDCEWRINHWQFLAPRQSQQCRIAITHHGFLRR